MKHSCSRRTTPWQGEHGRGFTLIELLVVVAIIGLLASVVLASLDQARLSARNAQRASDLRNIQAALELYRSDHQNYPDSSLFWRSECNAWGGYEPDNVIPGLVPTYMSNFPADPLMNTAGGSCCYVYRSNAEDYKLLAHNCAAELTNSSFNDPARDGGTNNCEQDGVNPTSWAVWNNAETSACW